MGIVICKKCGKPNKSHYKFCLSCGAMLTKDNIIVVEEDAPPQEGMPVQAAPGFAPPVAPPPSAPPVAPEPAPQVAPGEGVPPVAPPPSAPPMAPEAAPPVAPPPSAPPVAPEAAPPVAPPPSAPPMAPEAAPPVAPPPSAPPMAPEAAPPVAPPPSAPPMAPEPPSEPPAVAGEIDPFAETVAGDVTLEDVLRQEQGSKVEVSEGAKVEETAQPAPAEPSGQETGFVICPNCGAQVPRGFKFCGVCGAPIPQQEEQPAEAAPRVVAKLMLHDLQNGPTELVELVEGQEMVVGREVSDFMSNDSFASPRHAKLIVEDGQVYIEDLGSLNGVFVKIPSSGEPVPIRDGMKIRLGAELLRFRKYPEPSPAPDGTVPAGSPEKAWGRLELVTGQGKSGKAYALINDRYVIGREEGDIRFPEDGYVSGKHMEITRIEDEVFILDLQSSNGTYLSIEGRTRLEPGNPFLMGWRLYTIEPV